MCRLKLHNEVVQTLIAEDSVMKALDHAYENQITGMPEASIKSNIELAMSQGDDIKANMLANRLA